MKLETEKWIAAISVIAGKFRDPMTWFTALLVVVGILQWRTLEKSDATLKAQQRPWIELDAVIDGDLGWSGDELTLLVHFDLKNTGNSPALNLRQSSRTFLVWDDDLAHKVQKQLCEEFNKALGEEGWGTTVFPNANRPVRVSTLFEISKEEIDRFKTTPPKFARPLAVGCASYFSSVDHSVHNTGFMYLIRPRQAQLPFELPHKTIPGNSLDLVPWGSSRIN